MSAFQVVLGTSRDIFLKWYPQSDIGKGGHIGLPKEKSTWYGEGKKTLFFLSKFFKNWRKRSATNSKGLLSLELHFFFLTLLCLFLFEVSELNRKISHRNKVIHSAQRPRHLRYTKPYKLKCSLMTYLS